MCICVHIHTYTHTAHTHAQEHIREGKPPLNLLILLLHNIGKFCCKLFQKLPSTGAPIGRGIRKTAASLARIHSMISEAINKRQSRDNSQTVEENAMCCLLEGAEMPCYYFCKTWKLPNAVLNVSELLHHTRRHFLLWSKEMNRKLGKVCLLCLLLWGEKKSLKQTCLLDRWDV